MRYKEQYDRVLRWRKRLDDNALSRLDWEDYMLAFFQECWHLKDWIKNDKDLPDTLRNKIVSEVHSSTILINCRSLANGIKHLIFRSQETVGIRCRMWVDVENNPGIMSKDSIIERCNYSDGRMVLEVTQGDLHLKKPDVEDLVISPSSWMIMDNSKNLIDSLLFADNCIAEWDRILMESGL
jgi:hypothetical protein